MSFILGKKIKMTQIWKDDKIIPITLVQAGPITITQIKLKDKDKYEAVQVGFDATKKKLNKPLKGHLKQLGNFRYLKEFEPTTNNQQPTTYKFGDVLTVEQFQEGDKVKVSGITKGKGFQGVVKRHGFHGGPKNPGPKKRLPAP